MSTKTTFKRIALVAVAALGLGVLSVAPSSASVGAFSVTATNGTATTAVSDSTTAAVLAVNFLTLGATDSATVSFALKSKPTGSTAPTQLVYLVSDTATSTGLPTFETGTAAEIANPSNFGALNTVLAGVNIDDAHGLNIKAPTSSGKYTNTQLKVFFADTTTVTLKEGTYVYSAIVATDIAGVRTTNVTDISIVVSAVANQSKTASAVTSTAVMSKGSTWSATTTDSAVATVATADGTDRAIIKINLKNAAGGYAEESLTATITGPGLIGKVSGTYGKSITYQALATDGEITLAVRADGSAGNATISLSSTSVTFPAKTVTFFAKAAKTITPTVTLPVIAVGDNDGVVYATAVDANGANWGGAAYIVSSDTAVAGSATPVACSYNSAKSRHECPVKGIAAGTASLKVIDASTVALATATSAAVSVKVSAGVPTSVKLAFDKATYAPFEKATISVIPLDEAGNVLPAKSLSNLFATGGITSNIGFSANSETLTAVAIDTDGETNSYDYTVYMPAASGDVTISATGGTSLAAAGRVKVTATASVVNSSVDAATDAANEATDAANAATDAALAAADAADAATAAAQDASDAVAALSATVAKLVASLKAQITSLTNLVIKIQKKVKA